MKHQFGGSGTKLRTALRFAQFPLAAVAILLVAGGGGAAGLGFLLLMGNASVAMALRKPRRPAVGLSMESHSGSARAPAPYRPTAGDRVESRDVPAPARELPGRAVVRTANRPRPDSPRSNQAPERGSGRELC